MIPSDKEIREAVEILLKIMPQLSRLSGTLPISIDEYNAGVKTAIDLAQAYLNLKGFPEEREYPGQPYSQAYETIIPEIKGYNQSLKECKLAVMKMYSKERIYQALLNWEVNIEKANILTKEERLDMLKDLAQAISNIGGVRC